MDNKLSNIYNLSLEVFKILKDEYSIYLSKEKKEFLENLNINNFYKVVNNSYLPSIFYIGDKYYLNSYYNLDNLESLIPFLCLASLTSNLNPLKIGLIEEELLYLKDKYNLDIDTYFKEELEIAKLVSKSVLLDVPFKIIFKESDIDIVNYLVEEKGSNDGLIYYNISKKMKEIREKDDYFTKEKNFDYEEVKDYLYDYIGSKVK